MSYFQPFIDLPYPEFAAQPVYPEIEAVAAPEPVNPARRVEAVEDRPPDAPPTPEDVASMSALARSGNKALRRDAPAPPASEDFFGVGNSRALRELIQSFGTYDNSAAITRRDAVLASYSRFSPPGASTAPGDGNPSRTGGYGALQTLGIGYAGALNREERERMSREIDRWLAADGVFSPIMLGFASSDGFRFTPLSDAARRALREPEVLASYNRQRVAAYLRDMARLTPNDFLFYDPTGLAELALEQRRQFLVFMERQLERARVEARAAELRYFFDEQDRLELARLDLEREERVRLARLQDEISGYYASLRNSVKQYGPGIISASLS